MQTIRTSTFTTALSRQWSKGRGHAPAPHALSPHDARPAWFCLVERLGCCSLFHAPRSTAVTPAPAVPPGVKAGCWRWVMFGGCAEHVPKPRLLSLLWRAAGAERLAEEALPVAPPRLYAGAREEVVVGVGVGCGVCPLKLKRRRARGRRGRELRLDHPCSRGSLSFPSSRI